MICASALASIPHVAHRFFERAGGASRGLYAGLNCGPGSGDDPLHVAENRRIAAAALGVAPTHLISLYQVHSAETVTVVEPWTRETAPRADAMATAVPGIALGILAADCAPVLFADAEARVVGAAHAGWKGAIGGVLESCLDAMERLGAARARVHAVVGPCIAQASYEVGPEFEARFREVDAANARYFRPSARPSHYLFDLPGYVVDRLTRAGVGTASALGLDTYRGERFFSFRRTTHRGEPDYGRNLSAIALTK